MSGTPSLPDGFVLDAPPPSAPQQQPSSQLPPGFVPDIPPPQQTGPGNSILQDWRNRLGSDVLNAAASVASLPRAAAQGVDWLGRKVGLDVGADKALGSIPIPGSGLPASQAPLLPDYQTAKNAMFAFTGMPEYKATTLPGRMLDAGISNAIPSIIAPETIPAALGGGMTAEFGREIFPNHPFAATMLGFIPGAWLANRMADMAGHVGGAAVGTPVSQTAQAYDRLGIPKELTGDVTGAPGLQFAQKFAASMPGSEDAVKEASQRAVGAWQSALNNTAAKLGTASTAQEVGQSLVGAADKWLQNFKDQSGRLWSNFRLQVPGNTPVRVPAFRQTLGNILQEWGGADNLAKALQPGMAAKLKDALEADAGTSGTLPWQALSSARTKIGELLESPEPIADTSKTALKQLYGALTQDMRSGAQSISPNALSAFDRANAYTAAGHDLLDNHIGGLIQAGKAGMPEKATAFALANVRNGGSRVGAVTLNLPDAAGDLASYQLRTMAGPEASPTVFASAANGARSKPPVLSPEARNVLFPNPETAGDVDALARVGGAMKATEATANHSNTAGHAVRGFGKLVLAKELAETGHELAGAPGMVGGAALGFFGPQLMGRVAQMTALNPWLARLYSHAPLYQTQMPGLGIPMPSGRNLTLPMVPQQFAPLSWAPMAPATSASLPPQ